MGGSTETSRKETVWRARDRVREKQKRNGQMVVRILIIIYGPYFFFLLSMPCSLTGNSRVGVCLQWEKNLVMCLRCVIHRQLQQCDMKGYEWSLSWPCFFSSYLYFLFGIVVVLLFASQQHCTLAHRPQCKVFFRMGKGEGGVRRCRQWILSLVLYTR